MPAPLKTKLYEVTNCKQCPNCDTQRTIGAGCAVDYICKAAKGKTIAGYVEWDRESPQDHVFPVWCPLP